MAFVQGPERYLNELGIELSCAVDPTRPAMIDTRHRALVNHEAYFFSDDAALRAFVAEPYRYTGRVTDPVSLARFAPTSSSPSRSHGGRLFYFESEETAARFDADRATYGTPKPMMRERDPASG
jgi:YHS domain-containing protein